MEKVLRALGPLDVPRPAATAVVRRELAALRAGPAAEPVAFETVLRCVQGALDRLRAGRIGPVINGTGVLLHTNLGRAPLAAAAVAAVTAAGSNYCNLEYDLASGGRGSRGAYLEHQLALACGAEAATAVNNCAAALVLLLRHFTRREARREVVISRGELIQIGGGFRIPEIMEASGAQLREVGTTNQTTLEDYAAAIGPGTALVLKVHRSNFYLGGFEGSPHPAELAALARRRRVPCAEDLGSGALAATETLPFLEHERTPAEALRDGVDVVCFSGDKLLGGPQAGIIAGRARWVRALKTEPFFRALRCDKLVLSALQATVDLYLSGRRNGPSPPWKCCAFPSMLSAPVPGPSSSPWTGCPWRQASGTPAARSAAAPCPRPGCPRSPWTSARSRRLPWRTWRPACAGARRRSWDTSQATGCASTCAPFFPGRTMRSSK